ncbi:MAG: tetratricopeptide repeat protein [Alkalinema sp. FL-bin-369]|nr:tetratricopeptide repeat protein [Leptolyngbyaceae cyanobacterium LF-bin-369]
MYQIGVAPFQSWQEALKLYREIKDLRGEGSTLGNLGIVYYLFGRYPKAIEYQEQSLAIAREIKNRYGERITLNNLGVALARKEPELAIIFYKQSVNIAESIRESNRPLSRDLQSSYTETVAKTYRNLADLLLAQGRVLEALQVLELSKVQELHDFTKDTRYGGTADRNLLNPLEKTTTNAFDDKIKLGDRLTQCEQPKCSDRSLLVTQVTQANETFEQTTKRLKAALKSQESKDPAQLQNEEFTRNAQNIILNNPRKTLLLYPLVLDDKLWLVWGTQAGKKVSSSTAKKSPSPEKKSPLKFSNSPICSKTSTATLKKSNRLANSFTNGSSNRFANSSPITASKTSSSPSIAPPATSP